MKIRTKDFGDYTVKNVKTFQGREGYGYNASFYRGKKKIADVIDVADGGDARVNWLDNKESAILTKHLDKLPKVTEQGMELKINVGWFIGDCVDKFEINKNLKKIKRQMTNKTFFRHKDLEAGEYAKYDFPCNDNMRKHLRREYGDEVEIFNDVINNGNVPSVFE